MKHCPTTLTWIYVQIKNKKRKTRIDPSRLLMVWPIKILEWLVGPRRGRQNYQCDKSKPLSNGVEYFSHPYLIIGLPWSCLKHDSIHVFLVGTTTIRNVNNYVYVNPFLPCSRGSSDCLAFYHGTVSPF